MKITNNQAGNIVMEPHVNGIDIYIENKQFAKTFPHHNAYKVCCGSYFIGTLTKPAQA
jgi:hypothetical protein